MAQYYYTRKKTNGLVDDDFITITTQLILETAEKYGIDWEALPGTKILRLTYRGQSKYFRYQIPSSTTDVSFNSITFVAVSWFYGQGLGEGIKNLTPICFSIFSS